MQRVPPDESERELVAACVRGDQAAWKRFYARFQPLVERSAQRALGKLGVSDPAAQAQDVAAEVFAHLVDDHHAALARFQGRSSLETWLRVITRRQAARGLRRRRPGALAEPGLVSADDPSPSDEARVSERDRIVREQVRALAPRERLALQLFYEDGRSYRQVAAALDLPPARVGTILARARARLELALADRLG